MHITVTLVNVNVQQLRLPPGKGHQMHAHRQACMRIVGNVLCEIAYLGHCTALVMHALVMHPLLLAPCGAHQLQDHRQARTTRYSHQSSRVAGSAGGYLLLLSTLAGMQSQECRG